MRCLLDGGVSSDEDGGQLIIGKWCGQGCRRFVGQGYAVRVDRYLGGRLKRLTEKHASIALVSLAWSHPSEAPSALKLHFLCSAQVVSY
jgi:hypothetical protein